MQIRQLYTIFNSCIPVFHYGSNNRANSTRLRLSMLGITLPFHFRKDTYSLYMSCRHAPACVSSCFWGASGFPTTGMVPHDRRDRQEGLNHDRNGGTSGTTSACRHGAGCRPVRGLSYGSAVHRATVCARILCRAGAFPHHASPRRIWCRVWHARTEASCISQVP